jgi:signal transduction histidine kinase
MLLRSTVPGEAPRINRAFTDEYGLSVEDLISKPMLDWVHPDDRQALQDALEAGEGELLARHMTKQDDWRMLRWRVQTDEGRVVALAQSHAANESAIALPEAPPERKSSLTETLEMMVRILESKVDGCRSSILLVESDGQHVSVGAGPSMPPEYNRAVQGLRIGPTVGSCGTAAFWNVPVIVENIYEDPLWKDLREAAKMAGVSACWSVPVTGASGDDVLGAMALYRNEPAAPGPFDMELLEIAARMVGLAIEKDRMEEQLLEATKAEAIGVLAGGIAHDFNNLMAAVMGNAELAKMSIPEDSPAQINLERIVSSSEAASGLCKQMLAYAGRGSSSKEAIDCNLLARELGDLMKAALSKKVTMSFETHPSPLGIFADQSHLRQVFMNLITNASDAIGSADGRIVVGTKPVSLGSEAVERIHSYPRLKQGDYVHVWVSDTGEGMCQETKAKIFDPFFTTKATGHGLGLAAVLGIVKSHKGAISLESELGVGTTFSVWLPIAALSSERDAAVPATAGVPAGKRILIADDEVGVRLVIVAMLEIAGYSVVEVNNGEEAVDAFRSDPDGFDCVLLDLNMPKLDGEEAFTQLQDIRSDVRVILNSGFTEEEILKRFEGAGLAGVLHKPAPMEVLLDKVEKALLQP